MTEVKELWLGVRTRNSYDDCQKFGVYSIVNSINDKIYVGSTAVDFQKRWSAHSYEFRRNAHTNNFMQDLFNKYGGDVFEYYILEFVDDKDSIFEREQYYIDSYETVHPNGYNIMPIAGEWNPIHNSRSTDDRKTREPTSKYSDGGRYNFKRPYLVLNDDANRRIREELRYWNILEKDIDVILRSGIRTILDVYKEHYTTDKQFERIFKYCLDNLNYEIPTNFKHNSSINRNRDACRKCIYFDGKDDFMNLDYCSYYETHLPPIEINHCSVSDYSFNRKEVDMLKMFGRRHIDDVIEDYLNGADYSAKRSDYHR